MRTGGDDIAQGLALMGVKPQWDAMSGRVTGFEVLPLSLLGRPRVDVTLRISGFFRDAFPGLIALFDSAARAVMALDEPPGMNPAAAQARAGEGQARVYGSKPGAYGAGLQALIDERLWRAPADLGAAYLDWGGYAYGAAAEGVADRAGLEARLGQVQAIVQNQDNREHDLLDSDDYYQFEGGAAAAVTALQGTAVPVYHNDHSRPERPVIRGWRRRLPAWSGHAWRTPNGSRRDAPRLQGRVRDGGDGRLSVRLRRDDRRCGAASFRPGRGSVSWG